MLPAGHGSVSTSDRNTDTVGPSAFCRSSDGTCKNIDTMLVVVRSPLSHTVVQAQVVQHQIPAQLELGVMYSRNKQKLTLKGTTRLFSVPRCSPCAMSPTCCWNPVNLSHLPAGTPAQFVRTYCTASCSNFPSDTHSRLL